MCEFDFFLEEYEILFEEEKFAILFEKCYIDFALNNLIRHVNLRLDISESSQLLNNFLQTVADLIDCENLRETQIIDTEVLERLRALDPTNEQNPAIFEKLNRSNISTKGIRKRTYIQVIDYFLTNLFN